MRNSLCPAVLMGVSCCFLGFSVQGEQPAAPAPGGVPSVTAASPPPPPTSQPPPEPNDPALIPVTPTPGFYEKFPEAWQQMHTANLQRVAENAGALEVLLIGDSITLGWGGGWDKQPENEVWQRKFGSLRFLNLGIGGDKTQNILWRIEHGEVEGLRPKVVVLAVGVNNVWNWAVPPDAVAQGVRKCVETLRARLPAARLVVVNVFPTQERAEDPNRRRAKEISSEIARLGLDDGATVRLLDFGDRFLQPDGTLPKELMSDFLHPTTKGYEIYATALEEFLR